MENGINLQKGFTQRRLPWLIGGAALLIYLVTSSHWITFRGLSDLARVVGWDWHPRLVAPLHYLLTAPIRGLPAAWQLVALNSFSAICSALSLVLLARSVALLPHDRTRDQRQHERSDYSFLTIGIAWLPPVFAALVCGLQMTFWENAVISSGEALDLLLFAYVVRCLLEFRLSLKESWLMRMALVYGLGMTNNYAMIGFFPAFLAALIWIRGRSFFNLRFILRMAVMGLAGLSLYLLLPIVQSFSDAYDKGFWEMLRMNVGMQKNIVLHYPKTNIFLISLTSLLPVLSVSQSQLGQLLEERAAYWRAGVRATVWRDGRVTISAKQAVVVPITGACEAGCEKYGPFRVASVAVPENGSREVKLAGVE